jgi:hypothetical protein
VIHVYEYGRIAVAVDDRMRLHSIAVFVLGQKAGLVQLAGGGEAGKRRK